MCARLSTVGETLETQWHYSDKREVNKDAQQKDKAMLILQSGPVPEQSGCNSNLKVYSRRILR